MSQEQPPIRNRRELRRPRGERLEANQAPGTPGPAAVRPAVVDPGEPTEAEVTGRRRNAGPVDAGRTGAGSKRSAQARDRATPRTIRELAEKEVKLSGGGPPTRRQLRLLQLAAETAAATTANLIGPAAPAVDGEAPVADRAPADGTKAPGQKADGGTAGRGGQGPKGMTVEQALAARELLAQQARNQLAKMEHISATDPDAVDPDVLAEQTAVAKRAAAEQKQAERKQAVQKQAVQDSKPEPVRNDPATANNLAMVTPLEFVQVPGVKRPVMKRPATSHIPVVTSAGPRVEQPRKSGNGRPDPVRPAAGIPAEPQPDEAFAGRPPVAANTANGLEPLDADTAGLGRARRRRLVQLAVLALGVIALIAGGMLIIAGLSG